MPPHHTFNLSHPKLDKLFRRVQSTSAAHIVMMVDGWDDNGDIQATSNTTKTHIMGMCEFTKLSTMRSMEPRL